MDNYEEKYKAALGWMKGLYGGLHGATKEEAEKYFPELKESNGERIKFLIKSCVYASNITPEGRDEIFAWLEKQGEKDPCIGCTNDKGCVTCVDGSMKETKVKP